MGEDSPSGLHRYADSSTIHGIRDFLSTKSKVLKVIWGIFLLAAGGLLCEEVYRTVKNYQSEPTSFAIKVVDVDTFPTLHVCIDDWFDDSKLRKLGFEDWDVAYLCWYLGIFNEKCNNLLWDKGLQVDMGNISETEKVVRQKMENNNLTTVGDMLYLVGPTVSAFAGPAIKLRPWVIIGDRVKPRRMCYTVTNVTLESHYYYISMRKNLPGILVVGEDPFSMQSFEIDDEPTKYTIYIRDFNKLVLLNKRSGHCNHDYNSREICLADCHMVWAKCTCNLTSTVAFPYSNEDIWSLKPVYQFQPNDCDDTTDNATRDSCAQRRGICEEKCQPCNIWNHQYRSTAELLKKVPGQATMFYIYAENMMKVTSEYYAYPTSSLVSNIGGLMGLFCGASILSFVQATIFWLYHGCSSMRAKSSHGQKTKETQTGL